MFHWLGILVSRYWVVFLLAWIALAGTLKYVAPEFSSVAETGEFAFLPEDSQSLQAEALFRESFERDLLGSLVVIIAEREGRPEGLLTQEAIAARGGTQQSDFDFIEETLRPALEEIIADLPPDDGAEELDEESRQAEAASRVRTFSDKELGLLLTSADGQAALTTVELPNEFLDANNHAVIARVEHLLFEDEEFQKQIPPGLTLALSGSATVGRDMLRATVRSAKSTESLTVILVIVLLLLIYRAPLLAFVPMISVAISLLVALNTLALLAKYDIIDIFSGLNIYVTVLAYGAGVDFCLFLIARYKEAIDQGDSLDDAIRAAIKHVGPPLAGSAGTSIIGIGMMVFAEFGKFQQAGVAISIGLFFALISTLTFTPGLLRMFGSLAFWPKISVEQPGQEQNWFKSHAAIGVWQDQDWLSKFWKNVGERLTQYPLRILLLSVGIMSPFAVLAVVWFNYLSYGLLSELPDKEVSVVGMEAIQEHFPAGTLGPTTILLKNPEAEFITNESIESIGQLTEALRENRDELALADVRSVSHPLGITDKAIAATEEQREKTKGTVFGRVLRRRIVEQYVGGSEELNWRVTRIDLVFEDDPFSRNSLKQLERVEEFIREKLPEVVEGETEIYTVGPTAGIRDLKHVTDQDQIRIDILVLLGVYAVLVLILRKSLTSLYLITSVFFSYLVTLGVTFVVFWLWDPWNFNGLDWKVRMFLFTILIAVGEDYNIFLISRIDEETRRSDHESGILTALSRTGSIISSCGIIMAGTFSSLMAGYLLGMVQLGFALAFGVLLDTFVVRPLIVPAFLLLAHRGRLGSWVQTRVRNEFPIGAEPGEQDPVG